MFTKRFFCPITFEISSQSPNIISKIVFKLSVNSGSDDNSRANEPIIGKSYYNIHLNRKEAGTLLCIILLCSRILYSLSDYIHDILLATKYEIVFCSFSKLKLKGRWRFHSLSQGIRKYYKNAIPSGEFSRSSSLFQMLFDDFDVGTSNNKSFRVFQPRFRYTAGTLIAER